MNHGDIASKGRVEGSEAKAGTELSSERGGKWEEGMVKESWIQEMRICRVILKKGSRVSQRDTGSSLQQEKKEQHLSNLRAECQLSQWIKLIVP